MSKNTISWSAGRWTTEPVSVTENAQGLLVEAAEGSDAWRTTSYGFMHDDEHALLAPMPNDTAVEVSFVARFEAQFDQAGVFLKVADDCWVKAGVEFADGSPQLGAVVTNPLSDWSVAPVPEWLDRTVTVRASRSGDAVTIRARVDEEPFRLVRVVPLDPDAAVQAGPFTCAPTRSGLQVQFTGWRSTAPDATLHP